MFYPKWYEDAFSYVYVSDANIYGSVVPSDVFIIIVTALAMPKMVPKM